MTAPLLERVAGVPIGWASARSPGRGHQLDPVRVLSERHDVGIVATESDTVPGSAGDAEPAVQDVRANIDVLRVAARCRRTEGDVERLRRCIVRTKLGHDRRREGQP